MKLSLPALLLAMEAVRFKHMRLDPARIVVNNVDDWRTACLLEGLEPNANEPEPGSGGLCASFRGVPVIVAPLICPKGELRLLRGIGAHELAGSRVRHIVSGSPRMFDLTWEVIR